MPYITHVMENVWFNEVRMWFNFYLYYFFIDTGNHIQVVNINHYKFLTITLSMKIFLTQREIPDQSLSIDLQSINLHLLLFPFIKQSCLDRTGLSLDVTFVMSFLMLPLPNIANFSTIYFVLSKVYTVEGGKMVVSLNGR